MRSSFQYIAFTPPVLLDPAVAIAATRAGAWGILNCEYMKSLDPIKKSVSKLAHFASGPCGLRFSMTQVDLLATLLADLPAAVHVLVLSASRGTDSTIERSVLPQNCTILWEVTSRHDAQRVVETGVADGLIVKGHETGGWVGEETTFILLQRLLSEFDLPIYAYGGIGLHTAAACYVAGAAGVVLDAQLSLTRESRLPQPVKDAIARMDGSETACLGSELAHRYRVYMRPDATAAMSLQKMAIALTDDRDAATQRERWQEAIDAHVGWDSLREQIWPLGQDAALAAVLANRYKTVGGVLTALREAVAAHVDAAEQLRPLDEGSPLAVAHGTRYPIVQGPMTRVSDRAEFALHVAEAGGLPFLALALLRGPEVEALLQETKTLLGQRPWGVGILGFVPLALRQEQLDAIRRVAPPYAIIAGGRPDQALSLEEEGIPTYLHVPSPGLLRLFIADGARRFIFEGRECGGHVGPLSSFVLWNTMCDILLEMLDSAAARACSVLFAGGIHDRRSAAMVATMAAPLAERGVRIGVLMGTAYLFTQEAVSSATILPTFQEEAIRCDNTVLLESGPGHATRCLPTDFVAMFNQEKLRLQQTGQAAEEIRHALEALNIGRLRIASKGITRRTAFEPGQDNGTYVTLTVDEQRQQGMYMIGQVAALRNAVCNMAGLHHEVAVESSRYLATALAAEPAASDTDTQQPSNIAIVGMGGFLPKAANLRQFWANVLDSVDAITQVPAERWDASLYYDEDRQARDKIYSRAGGFLDDLPFNPIEFGIPPNSLRSIDPMHVLALLAARDAIADAGYAERPFDRSRTSVILGASGGTGDLGANYMLRAGLPQLFGEQGFQLAAEAGDGLPEWTEDSFAGLLVNVAAGRIANRFDLGGLNFTVDAACASSLAAIHLAVKELETHNTDMVLVGGVDTVQNPFGYLCFSKTQALSPTGEPRVFDASGDGIVISEGVVILALRRLEDAERDGDRIYAVIQGVGASSDGRAKGMTAPRPEGQALALHRAYAKAGFSPTTVGYFEAHGTGTVVGDQTEVTALADFLKAHGAQRGSHAVGSVKSMIGHTKATAGVVGLAKVAHALYYKVLPPTLRVVDPNPKAGFGDGPLYVNAEARPWLRHSWPRRAGVSAFGFGGTNFHAVLEEYTDEFLKRNEAVSARWPSELLLWPRLGRQQLLSQVAMMEAALAGSARPVLADLAYTLWCLPSEETGVRLAIVANDLDDLREKFAVVRAALMAPETCRLNDRRGIYLSDEPLAVEGQVALIYPSQESLYPHMLRDLAVHFDEVRETFEAMDSYLADRFAQPLSHTIFPPSAFSDEAHEVQRQALMAPHEALPALATACVALHRLLAKLGVQGAMAAGHGCGEYAALFAAGVFDEAALAYLSEAHGSAMTAAIDGELGTVDPAKLVGVLANVVFVPPQIAVYSNTTATVYPNDGDGIRDLLSKHSVQPMRFNEQIEAMYVAGARLFVEVGPNRVTSEWVDQILGERAHLAVAVDSSSCHGITGLQHALAALSAHGVSVDLSRLFEGRSLRQLRVDRLADETGTVALPPTTWFVNGARVRPSREGAEAPQWPRLAHLSLLADNGQTADEIGPEPQHGAQHANAYSPEEPLTTPLSEMTARPLPDEATVLVSYEQVMDHFLVAQRDVMQTFLAQTVNRDETIAPLKHNGQPNGVSASGKMASHSTPREAQEAIPRSLVMAVEALPLSAQVPDVTKAGVMLVSDDGGGVAVRLAERIRAMGGQAVIVAHAEQIDLADPRRLCGPLTDAECVAELVATVRTAHGPIGGILHLAPLGRGDDFTAFDLSAWQDRLALETKSLFYLARAASADFEDERPHWLLAATTMGGSHGYAAERVFVPGQGGIDGLVKTLAQEWPSTLCKAVDFDPAGSPDDWIDQLLAEMATADGLVEVGYGGGRRQMLQPVLAPLASEPALVIESDWVLLVTGGARGITAEVARQLAVHYSPTIVLVGRSPLPPIHEAATTAHLSDPRAIKAAMIEEMRHRGEAVLLPAVEAAYQQLLKEREIRLNLAHMQQAGATVIYVQADVRDEPAMRQLVHAIYRQYGRLDGVIHGAGIIEDKLLAEKTPASFDRVFDTKADSAFILSRLLRPEGLKFLAFFSSAAGTFGNRGQGDYAATNEVVNKLALHLDRQWPGRVVSLNWGPWLKTGMVDSGLQEQFNRRNIQLISIAAGCRAFEDEVCYGRKGDVVVVWAGGDWGGKQIRPSESQHHNGHTQRSVPPLQQSARIVRRGDDLEVIRCFDPAVDRYLHDHQLDGKPVVPLAMVMEWMAESVQQAWPELTVSGLRDVQVLHGIILDSGPQTVRLIASAALTGEPGMTHGDVMVNITSAEGGDRLHYRGIVELSQHMVTSAIQPNEPKELKPFPFSVAQAYEQWLFHGPLFQGIEHIEGISPTGLIAVCRPSTPANLVADIHDGEWLIDPVILDSGLQMIILWMRHYHDVTPLPARVARYRRLGPLSCSPIRCVLQAVTDPAQPVFAVDIRFDDVDGNILGLLEGMQCSSSKALNRLTGSGHPK